MQCESLLTNGGKFPQVLKSPLLRPFDDVTFSFLAAFSKRLLGERQFRAHPDFVALGFWLREAKLNRIQVAFSKHESSSIVKPRGTVLHFPPSNVDVMSIYSWVPALLCGNRNLVRLSSRRSAHFAMLLSTLDELLSEESYEPVREMNAFFCYDRDDATSRSLSEVADVRVIWGGDATVKSIRQFPIRATATEVTFANKFSITVIDTSTWGDSTETIRKSVAEKFAIDAYTFQQQACSSPLAVVWVGPQISEEHREVFWRDVSAASRDRFGEISDIEAMNKLVATSLCATRGTCAVKPSLDNRLVRVAIDRNDLASVLGSGEHCGSGLFYESEATELAELLPLTSRGMQTVSYFGLGTSELSTFVEDPQCLGVDRVVPIGGALDFDWIWDGYDLLETYCRRITVR